jgi:hypothetical protein
VGDLGEDESARLPVSNLLGPWGHPIIIDVLIATEAAGPTVAAGLSDGRCQGNALLLWLVVLGRLQQCVPGELPTGFVRRADEAAREMRRAIFGPIKMCAVASCLSMEQPARRVIPRHQLVVEQQVAMPRRSHSLFMRGTPKPRTHSQP